MDKKKLLSYLVLVIYVIAIILYHIFGYIGHYGFDDLHYAQLSAGFIDGKIDFDDHFVFRFPVILLTSLSYYLFGISDFSSSLPALIISFSILYIVFLILRDYGYISLVIGLSLTTFSNWFVFYSDKLMPDIYIALSVILVLAVIYKYKYFSNGKQPVLFSVLLAFSLLFGFMCKGTIVLILPLLVYYFMVDLINRRDMKFWIYSIISGIVILALYFILIWILTGDLMKRFESITNNGYLNLCSYGDQPINILLNRLSYEFFNMLVYKAMAAGFIFVIAVFFRRKAFAYFKMDDPFSFFLVSSVILLLSSNFMTISLTAYNPMCLDPRHYLFLIPVVSVPASIIITGFIENKKYAVQIIIMSVGVSAMSFFLQGNTFWELYLPLSILFIVYLFIKPESKFKVLFTVLFISILLIVPIEKVIYSQEIKYSKQKEIINEYILNKNEDCIVVTNYVQKQLGNYYGKYDQNRNTKIVSYDEFEFNLTDAGKKLLFLNWYTRYLSIMDFDDLPYYAKNIPLSFKVVYENKDLEIAIYEMIDFSKEDLEKNTLLYSFNGFEEQIPNWNQYFGDISTEIKYAGEKSIQVKEYSSTFQYPLDSIQIISSGNLLIRCKLFCYLEDKTNSKIVVSIENDEGTYLWRSLDVNKYIKAYTNWWPVNYEVNVSFGDLKKQSLLKVFLWNPDQETVSIDNFEIRLVKIKD